MTNEKKDTEITKRKGWLPNRYTYIYIWRTLFEASHEKHILLWIS